MSHVAYVVPTLDKLGGAEQQVLTLAHGFLARNWQVSVVALSGSGGDSARDLRASGAKFQTLEMRKGLIDPRGWIRFHRWFVTESPDIVHAHLPHAAWLARWSRLFARIPVLIDTIHTSATGTLGRRLGYRVSAELPDRVSAVSHGVAAAYESAHMVASGRLLVVPNAVDVNRWHPDLDRRAELRRWLGFAGEFLWLAAGRLDPVKDYPSLLRAMSEVPHSAHLVIAGAGPEELNLRRLAIQSGIESRVRFLGFQPEMLPWMQAADAFVLSSRWEGLPVSLLEAGACALPAVATDVPGSREIILNGKTGFLAPAKDSAALRDAIVRLMRLTAAEREDMGQRARQRIICSFGLEAVLNRWESIYRELLAGHPRPVRGH